MSHKTYNLNASAISRLKSDLKRGERIWIYAGSGSGKSWLAEKLGGWDLDLSAKHVMQSDGKTKWTVFLDTIPKDSTCVAGCFNLPDEVTFMAYWKPTKIVFIMTSRQRYEANYLWKVASKMNQLRVRTVLGSPNSDKVFHKIESLEGGKSDLYEHNVLIYLKWINDKVIGPKIPVEIAVNNFSTFEGSAWHNVIDSWGTEVIGLVDLWHQTKDKILQGKIRDMLIETGLNPTLNPAFRVFARDLQKCNVKIPERLKPALMAAKAKAKADNPRDDKAWHHSQKAFEAILDKFKIDMKQLEAGALNPVSLDGKPPLGTVAKRNKPNM